MQDHHEFRYSRSTNDGMIGRLKISYLEDDMLHPEVLSGTEGDT